MREALEVLALLGEESDADADAFRRVVENLPRLDVQLDRASDLAELEARLAEKRFDVVFRGFDSANAKDVMGLLRRLADDEDEPPVILLVSSGDEVSAFEAMDAGACDYVIQERLDGDVLARSVRYALDRRRMEMERAHLAEKLAELTVIDELTNLPTSKRLRQVLEEEIVRSSRTGRPFAVLIADLDHFSRINEQHGRRRGDQVLKLCAGALEECVRGMDFVARYGGEEFCVILREIDADYTREVADRLLASVKALPDPATTISIGMAVWEPDHSADDLLRMGDNALAQAKQGGRDRAVLCAG